MYKTPIRFLVVCLVVLIGTYMPLRAAQAQDGGHSSMSPGCEILNYSELDKISYGFGTFMYEFYAGEVVHVRADYPLDDTGGPLPTGFYLMYGDTTVGTSGFPGTLSYEILADEYSWVLYVITADEASVSQVSWIVSCSSPYAAPGSDMIEIPEGSVMGTFSVPTELLWMPDESAGTGAVMEAGQTLWVTGLDESRQFYQVILSGGFYWVSANNLSLTYDDLWDGAALPTGVVD